MRHNSLLNIENETIREGWPNESTPLMQLIRNLISKHFHFYGIAVDEVVRCRKIGEEVDARKEAIESEHNGLKSGYDKLNVKSSMFSSLTTV